MNLLFIAELVIDRAFELISDPVTLLSVLNVHELHTNVLTVSFLEPIDYVSKFPPLLLSEESLELRGIQIKLSLEVSVCEAPELVVELMQVSLLVHASLVSLVELQRVKVSCFVAIDLVGPDHVHDLETFMNILGRARTGSG